MEGELRLDNLNNSSGSERQKRRRANDDSRGASAEKRFQIKHGEMDRSHYREDRPPLGNRRRSQRGNNPTMSGGPRSGEDIIAQRLKQLGEGPLKLEPLELPTDVKFSGRNRLYVGSLTGDINEDELRELFKPYGEIDEIFLSPERSYAFLKVDYHQNAEKAQNALDCSMRNGRQMRVRFAANATMVRVWNLRPSVSNELLQKSFEIFGPIERATIRVDSRGNHTGEGIVEFERKSSANACLRWCTERCYFLTESPRPCLVEPYTPKHDNGGIPERSLNKSAPEFIKERSVGPRFAERNSMEHDFGSRWKRLVAKFKDEEQALKRSLELEENDLEAQFEYLKDKHETDLLREELRKREEREMRNRPGQARNEMPNYMLREEEEFRRPMMENTLCTQARNEMSNYMLREEEEFRRPKMENTLCTQAEQMTSLLHEQESGYGNSPFQVFNRNSSNNSSMMDTFRGNDNINLVEDNSHIEGSRSLKQKSLPFEFDAPFNVPRENNRGNIHPWERF